MTTKFCPDCGVRKSVDDFYTHKTGALGRNTYCKACTGLRSRASRERRAVESKAWYRTHYDENRTEILERCRARYAAKSSDERQAVMQRQRDRLAELTSDELATRRDRKALREQRRRALKRARFVEDVHPLVVLERDDNVCGICGEDVDPTDFHVDHIVPLARGGEHSYANVQTTHPKCNYTKGARVGVERS